MITFSCPSCHKSLSVKDELAGRTGKCPQCQQLLLVPKGSILQVPASHARTSAARPRSPDPVPTAPAASSSAQSQPGTHGMASSEDATFGPLAPDVRREHYDFLAPPQAPGELGRLGPYRILRVLGAGGMGVVFLAEDLQLERKVALKAMLPTLAASDSARQRFLREAKTAAAIEHDHIVPIYQVGEDRGVPFIAMPFLQGEPLDKRLERQQRLPLAEVLRIGRETALGLAAAHERGLVHRDIKPANLWLEGVRGRVKILDFGLARAAAKDSQLTQQGAILGTPAYMAPEQASGGAVDARCDLFSLGCVLYRMCTGKAPFKGTDAVSTLLSVAMDQPEDPRLASPEVPEDLAHLVMQLLAKQPQQRPQSAQAVVQALEAVERQGGDQTFQLDFGIDTGTAASTTRSRTAGTRAGRSGQKGRPWPWLVGGGVLGLAVLALATFLIWPKPRGVDRSTRNEPGGERIAKKPAPPVKDDKELRTRRAAEWVLSIGGKVTIVVLGKEYLIASTNALPAGGIVLTKINLWGNPHATDDGIGHLEGLTDLRDLQLGQTPVGDAGLAHLEGLTSLKYLAMRCPRVSDAGLVHLKGLTSLERLNLGHTSVSDAGLQTLPTLPNLRSLCLDKTDITGRGLGQLARLPKLTELLLAGSKVSDSSAAEVGRLTKLEKLSLAGCPFSDAGLEPLAGLGRLKSLDLTGTQVAAEGIARLHKALPKCQIIPQAIPAGLKGFTTYGGVWRVQGGDLHADAGEGSSLIRDEPALAASEVGVEILLPGKRVGDAGLVLKVDRPGIGVNAFTGYQITLDTSGHLVVGRHRGNWEPIRRVPCPVPADQWLALVVRMTGATLEILVNGKSMLKFTDTEHPLPPGRIGLRTWQRPARFRSLWMKMGEETRQIPFTAAEPGSGGSALGKSVVPRP